MTHKDISEYTLTSPPPADHPELAPWVWGLFEDSYAEKERLGLMERWKANYRLFRGNHWGEKARGNPDKITINLNFANIQRTVANITAKNPVAKVIDLDGNEDNADQVLTMKMKKWWNETEQQGKLARSSLNNEIYGITTEKAVWISAKKEFIPIIMDAYSYFPAPGYYEEQGDMPYEIHAFSLPVYDIENTFGVEGVTEENVDQILGREDREEVRPNTVLSDSGVGVVLEQSKKDLDTKGAKGGQALVVELWIKDSTKHDADLVTTDDETGAETIVHTKGQLLYPDGVRVITITNKNIFLNDMPNPNVNFELDQEKIRTSFAWGRRPFYKANSYEDTTSIWGFSAGEQTGDLNKKINEIVSRIAAYCNRVLFPTLIVEKGCGITKSMINNKPGLVLMPTRPNARIEYIPVPNLPSNFFQILDLLVNFHDRVYQIEDADRGVQPTGVTAASAIVALQERNAVLIRHKIRATEFLCRMRGRWNISFIQNFSVKPEKITMADETVYEFSGIELAGREFNYIIESDSTVARTSAGDQEQAVGLYKINAIDRTALLDALNYKDKKQIIERMGETQLDEAFNVLVQAGMEEDAALQLRQFLMQPQNGPESETAGDGGAETAAPPQAGTPVAQQGVA
jgi:hypothetical protein